MAIPMVDATANRRNSEHQSLTEQLQSVVLGWDFWDIQEKLQQHLPVIPELEAVPTSFTSLQHYVRVFEKLVLEECAALTLQIEGSPQLSHTSAVASLRERDCFWDVSMVLEADYASAYSENDLVLVSMHDPVEETAEEDMEEASLSNALAWVQGRDGDSCLLMRFHVDSANEPPQSVQARRCEMMRLLLKENSVWKVLRLSNMATITREWVALHLVGKLPFCDVLIKPNTALTSAPARTPLHVPPLMKEVLEQEYNDSQRDAIEAGLDGMSVILIQGPPGTGKTRTILGLLSIILHAAPPGVAALTREATGSALEPPEPAARQRLWRQAAPWIIGAPNPREAVRGRQRTGSQDDAFGLTSVGVPVRISAGGGPKPHVLVCTPSNSALDEIVARLLRFGLVDRQGRRYKPSVVRVGLSVHHSVESVSLEAAVSHRLKISEDAAGPHGPSRVARDRARAEVLEEADIVCSTLSFSGSGIFSKMSRGFDVVVIDEAAQAVEPSTLVPLVAGVKQVYFVGDPEQLPATVISARAVERGYDTSLFKRLQQANYPVQVLNTQYRMHPLIASFPSEVFYNGKLFNGEGVQEATTRPWHTHGCLGPLVFFDVRGKERVVPGTSSMVNNREAELVIFLYSELQQRYPQLASSNQIAIISPYKAQVKFLKENFRACHAWGEEKTNMLDINTIDGFQGREKDVVIFSPVRTKERGGIGFVSDERRMNVGLTRARSSLIVVGHGPALRRDPHWKAFIDHATKNRCVYRVHPPSDTFLSKAIAGIIQPVEPTATEAEDFMVGHDDEGDDDEDGGCEDGYGEADENVPEGDDADEDGERERGSRWDSQGNRPTTSNAGAAGALSEAALQHATSGGVTPHAKLAFAHPPPGGATGHGTTGVSVQDACNTAVGKARQGPGLNLDLGSQGTSAATPGLAAESLGDVEMVEAQPTSVSTRRTRRSARR